MPNTLTLRKTCSIAWICASAPGEPKTRKGLPFLNAMAGLGVKRGRLPGATAEGGEMSGLDCDTREDGQSPVTGIKGVSRDTALGVAEKALPRLSPAER